MVGKGNGERGKSQGGKIVPEFEQLEQLEQFEHSLQLAELVACSL